MTVFLKPNSRQSQKTFIEYCLLTLLRYLLQCSINIYTFVDISNEMRKNILFIFNNYPGCGGLESVSNNIIEYLGEKHSIYTLSINIHDNVYAPPSIQKMYKFDSVRKRKKSVEQLNQIIESHKIDCIIDQGIYPDISDILFHPKRKNVEKVFSFLHGMPKYEIQQCQQIKDAASPIKKLKHKFLSSTGLYRKYDRYVNRFADSYKTAFNEGTKIVLLCEDYIESFKRAYQLEGNDQKIIAIANPLSPLFSTIEAPTWVSKKNKILFVGRLAPEKRVDIVLDVWSRANKDNDWELVIVGDGQLEQLQEIVRLNGIERVTFTGQLESVKELYEESKIILLTSLHEGFAMCLSEALRFGVVPIAFQTSDGVKSVVADAGILVPQDDRDCMTEQLIRLINDQNELYRLSQKARDNSNRYTLQVIGKQWDELIDN